MVAGSYNGILLFSDIHLPLLLPSASYIYETLIEIDTIKYFHESIKGKLFAALQKSVQKTIDPFILGLDILPSVKEVKQAIRKLEYALNLYEDNNILNNKVLSLKLVS